MHISAKHYSQVQETKKATRCDWGINETVGVQLYFNLPSTLCKSLKWIIFRMKVDECMYRLIRKTDFLLFSWCKCHY